MGPTNATLVLSHESLCALVSPGPDGVYSEEILDHRLQDVEWLTVRAKRHEEIVRCASELHTVIQCRSGTWFSDERKVLTVLEEDYARLDAQLTKLMGEWRLV